ncbi:hypothetical protein N431DRAFT_475020 [Stipitochalara longipes BDJ]|nr:hypothetical protein N431DRAFT_475020 [Stipitochalara longipes BDJ]
MNTLVPFRLLRTSLNELRAEIRVTLDDQARNRACSVVENERAIAALGREFRASEKDNNCKIRELEGTVKVLIDAHNRKRDDLDGLEREVRRQVKDRDQNLGDMVERDREMENRSKELERRSGRY